VEDHPVRTKIKFINPDAREPLGIVIADGGPVDAAPRFSAFVWGPVPEELDELATAKQFVVAAA
jgi:hypothetical protein